MRLRRNPILLAAAALAAPGCAGDYAAQSDPPVARLTSLNNCAYAPTAAYALESDVCEQTMDKVGISDVEIQTIRTCKWAPPQAAFQDPACNAERARFPALFYARPVI